MKKKRAVKTSRKAARPQPETLPVVFERGKDYRVTFINGNATTMCGEALLAGNAFAPEQVSRIAEVETSKIVFFTPAAKVEQKKPNFYVAQ